MPKETKSVENYFVEVSVDSSGLDEAIEKLERLVELAKEANTLGVLASAED